MKNLFLFSLVLLIVFPSAAQKVGGFYKGTLYNDSTRMTQQYELALAEYRGKIMGYSYVTFVANDTFYYGIRKIKARIEGDSLIVEDDKMIANNFPEAPARHVNRLVSIPFNGQDSLVSINGRWKTNPTKKYYAVPGSVKAAKTADSSSSALFAHLRELGLMPNENNYVATESRGTETAEPATDAGRKEGRTSVRTPSTIASGNKDNTASSTVNTPPADRENSRKKKTEDRKEVAVTKEKTKTENRSHKPADLPVQPQAPQVLAYKERREHVQQTVDVRSDSLLLSFFDNGVVDGDSVSIYMNDQPVVSHMKLTSVASKKTIYLGGLREVKLVLVADNLGSIPPNTGLLVIRDGDRTYQVNFTADMQTNASIVITRKGNTQ